MTEQDRQQIFDSLDAFTASRKASIEAENRAAKVLINVFFEVTETEIQAHRQTSKIYDASLMTIKEIAAHLKVTPRSIRTWIDDDGFPVRYVGADPRFDLAEVEEWTKRNRKNARNATGANGKVPPLQRDCKRDGSKNNVSL